MSTDGKALTPQNAGYYEGVTDVWYALTNGQNTEQALPSYSTPKVAGKSVEISVTPNFREAKVYASDYTTRREQRVESYTVSLNLDQLIPSVRQELLGRTAGADGVELVTGKNLGPWVALLFAATLDDGSKEYWRLFYGRFSEPGATHHTRNDGESYQHPVIQGIFLPLARNGRLGKILGGDAVSPRQANLLRRTGTLKTWAGANAAALTETPVATYALTDDGTAAMPRDVGATYTAACRMAGKWPGNGATTLKAHLGLVIGGAWYPFTPGGEGQSIGNGVNGNTTHQVVETFTLMPAMAAAIAAGGAQLGVKLSGGTIDASTATSSNTLIRLQEAVIKRGDTARWSSAPEDWFEQANN